MIIQYYTKQNIGTGGSVVENVTAFSCDNNIGIFTIYRKDYPPLTFKNEDLIYFMVSD